MLSRSFGWVRVRLEKSQRRLCFALSLRDTLSASFRSGNSSRRGAAAARSRGPSSGSSSISRRTVSRMSFSSFFVSSASATLTLDLRSTLPLAADARLDPAELSARIPASFGDLVEQIDGPVASAGRRPGGRLEGPLDRGAQGLRRLLRDGELDHDRSLPPGTDSGPPPIPSPDGASPQAEHAVRARRPSPW